jgi:hypothetical protein
MALSASSNCLILKSQQNTVQHDLALLAGILMPSICEYAEVEAKLQKIRRGNLFGILLIVQLLVGIPPIPYSDQQAGKWIGSQLIMGLEALAAYKEYVMFNVHIGHTTSAGVLSSKYPASTSVTEQAIIQGVTIGQRVQAALRRFLGFQISAGFVNHTLLPLVRIQLTMQHPDTSVVPPPPSEDLGAEQRRAWCLFRGVHQMYINRARAGAEYLDEMKSGLSASPYQGICTSAVNYSRLLQGALPLGDLTLRPGQQALGFHDV